MKLFLLAAAALLCVLHVASAAKCANPAVRKEFRDATEEERQRYLRAFKGLKDNGVLDLISTYHNQNTDCIHNHINFLAFHRWFVKAFENSMLEVDQGVTMLYWDTMKDAAQPEKSLLLTDAYLGGNGDPQSHCVMDGFAKGWEFNVATKHCLQRQYSQGATINPFYTLEALIYQLGQQATSYGSLSQLIEGGCHAKVHDGIGGDMMQMYSPNDIIFWLHHTNLDMIYYVWQMVDPATRLTDVTNTGSSAYLHADMCDGTAFSSSSPILGYEHAYGEVVDPTSELLCYTYEMTGSAQILANAIANSASPAAGSPTRGIKRDLLSGLGGLTNGVTGGAAGGDTGYGSGGDGVGNLVGGLVGNNGPVGGVVGGVVGNVGDALPCVGGVVDDLVDQVGDLTQNIGESIKHLTNSLGFGLGDMAKTLGLSKLPDLSILQPHELKIPELTPVSEMWVNMTRISPEFVDRIHQEANQVIRQYNSNPNYISPSCIMLAARKNQIKSNAGPPPKVTLPPLKPSSTTGKYAPSNYLPSLPLVHCDS